MISLVYLISRPFGYEIRSVYHEQKFLDIFLFFFILIEKQSVFRCKCASKWYSNVNERLLTFFFSLFCSCAWWPSWVIHGDIFLYTCSNLISLIRLHSFCRAEEAHFFSQLLPFQTKCSTSHCLGWGWMRIHNQRSNLSVCYCHTLILCCCDKHHD